MKQRRNNQLPHNLPQLQNLIKRDPPSYRDEFLQQVHHFESLVQIMALNPQAKHPDLESLVLFLAQVAHCFPEELKDVNLCQCIIDVLRLHLEVLQPDLRMSLCKALVMLRNKDLVSPARLTEVFFTLVPLPDRKLREYIVGYILNDIKMLNMKKKNSQMNGVLQNYVFGMLRDSNTIIAKTALKLMKELYRKNIWHDAKTVTTIAETCFSKVTKVMVSALEFFLGRDPELKDPDSESESETEEVIKNPKEMVRSNRVNKKSRKRQKLLSRLKTAVKKQKNKKKAPAFNFSAFHLLHDPQGFAEKLFHQLEKCNERFEVRLMHVNLISRLVGIHELLLLSFYPFLHKFLQPHQKDVIHFLTFAAQAVHPLVPPDVIEALLKTIANNFVTDRNRSEVMAVGLNAIREISARSPSGMTEELLEDLAAYKSHREKPVAMAAKSLITLFREVNPALLHKKHRGLPKGLEENQAGKQEYGALNALDYIPGAGVLRDDDDDDEGPTKEKAREVSENQILSQEDFKKIAKAKVEHMAGIKSIPRKRKRQADSDSSEEDTSEESSDEESRRMPGLVLTKDIGMVQGLKRAHHKEARLASIEAGREGREGFAKKLMRSNPNASTSNKEKKKLKPFMMVRPKLKRKNKRSFVQKQIALRNALLKQKKLIVK